MASPQLLGPGYWSRLQQQWQQTRRREHLLGALFFIVAAGAVIPLWLVPYPPMQDVAQHLAAIRVIHSYNDPFYGFAQHFELHLLRTQYLAYYEACHLLAYLVDVRTANLLVISAVIVAIPYAGRALLRALGRDPLMALWLVPLTYNAHLISGFLNFISAIPLMLYGLSLGVRQQVHYERRRAIGLSLLLLLCFFTHVVPFALLCLGLGLLALGRSARRMALAWWPALPSLLAVLLWLSRSPAGVATAEAAGLAQGVQRVSFRPYQNALRELPMWLTEVFAGKEDLASLKAYACSLLALIVVFPILRAPSTALSSTRQALRFRLLPLPLVCAVGYFVLPSGYGWIWPIAERFPLLALYSILPALPRPRPWARAVALSGALLFSGWHVQQASTAFFGFDEEVGDFDAALAAIPPRKSVMGLIFDRGSRHIRFSPFLHYVAHYQVQKGGMVMFTFADFPQSPFSFKPQGRPPKVPPRWEWMPQRVDPRRIAGHYEYLLVRGRLSTRILRSRLYDPIFRGKRWSVYQRH